VVAAERRPRLRYSRRRRIAARRARSARTRPLRPLGSNADANLRFRAARRQTARLGPGQQDMTLPSRIRIPRSVISSAACSPSGASCR